MPLASGGGLMMEDFKAPDYALIKYLMQLFFNFLILFKL